MLILARRVGESIVISGEVIVKVISVDGSQVRLGIAAPRSVKVLRGELYKLAEETLPTIK